MPLMKELSLFLIINYGHVGSWLALLEILTRMYCLSVFLQVFKDEHHIFEALFLFYMVMCSSWWILKVNHAKTIHCFVKSKGALIFSNVIHEGDNLGLWAEPHLTVILAVKLGCLVREAKYDAFSITQPLINIDDVLYAYWRAPLHLCVGVWLLLILKIASIVPQYFDLLL